MIVSSVNVMVRTEDGPVMTGVSQKSTHSVRVGAITREAEDILSFELVDPAGRDLPWFTAGAHIDVHIGDGMVRQFSLCNDPSERHRYVIAVLKEPDGRGGSRALHDTVRPGGLLSVSEPRNYFPLAEDAAHHLLLAGGIGVTPMMAMVEALEAKGADYFLHYCARAPENTAFLDRLRPLVDAGRVALHHDGGDPRRGLDIDATLKNPEPGTHLYYCGPPGFMSAAASAVVHWPEGTVHFEYFTAPEDGAAGDRENTPFQVKIASTGDVFGVPADKTIVEVLREAGLPIDTSCEDGYCGTCLTRYLEGEPEHRDMVLDDEDRAEFVLICCARAKTSLLVLDL